MNVFSLQFDVYKVTVLNDDEVQETEMQLSLNGEYYYSVRYCGDGILFKPRLNITVDSRSLEKCVDLIISRIYRDIVHGIKFPSE